MRDHQIPHVRIRSAQIFRLIRWLRRLVDINTQPQAVDFITPLRIGRRPPLKDWAQPQAEHNFGRRPFKSLLDSAAGLSLLLGVAYFRSTPSIRGWT